MTLRTFLLIKAIASLIMGIAFVLAPQWVMGIFGVTLDEGGIFVGRLFGAFDIGIGLVCWLARNAERAALRDIALGFFVGDTVGTIVALAAQLAGVMNGVGWVAVFMWFILAFGLGYFRFVDTEEAGSTTVTA